MGFSIFKGIRLGKNVRLNISARGLGISTGIKGLRVGVGPRGTRLSGSHGPIRYQKLLSNSPMFSRLLTLGAGALITFILLWKL